MKTYASSSLQLLLPLDGSALAEQVVPVVQGLASCIPVTVRLLHVVAPGLVRQLVLDDKALFAAAGEPDDNSADETAQVQDVLLTESRRYLEQLAQRLAATIYAGRHRPRLHPADGGFVQPLARLLQPVGGPDWYTLPAPVP